MRLDLYLSTKNAELSRSRAANLIELGKVSVDGKIVKKCAFQVDDSSKIEILEDYGASLGGLKLARAIEEFQVDIKDKICLDVGASNGGFTEVLLNNGAKMVYALDVGECALPDKLKNDSRVAVMDRTNARLVTKADFSPVPEIAVIDVSFISLTLILKQISDSIAVGGGIIALIKPQFECSQKDLSKKGIVISEKVRLNSVKKIEKFCGEIGLAVAGKTTAPHPFVEKNVEYLIYLKKF